MKMNLKNKKKIDVFTKKNYFVFLISFFIISIIIGGLFFLYLNSNDKETIVSNIKSTFTIKENYSFLRLLFDSLKSNTFNTIFIWILGISIVGIIYNINIFFFEGFSIGFTIIGIIDAYGIKGILGIICFLFPSKLIYIFLLFVLSYFSINFSYNLVECLFFKKDINLKEKMHKYFKILVFSVLISIIYSFLEVFINPIMIKVFTFILK